MEKKTRIIILLISLLGVILSNEAKGIGHTEVEVESSTIKWLVNTTITDSSFPIILNATKSYELAINTSWGGWQNESVSKSLDSRITEYFLWVNVSESSLVGAGAADIYINGSFEVNHSVTWNKTKSSRIPIRVTYVRSYNPGGYPLEENRLTINADMSASLSKHFYVTHDPYGPEHATRVNSFAVTADELNTVMTYLTQNSAQNWQYWVDDRYTPPPSIEADKIGEIRTTIEWNDSTVKVLKESRGRYITETASEFNEIIGVIFDKYLPGPPSSWPNFGGGGTIPDSTTTILLSPFTMILFLLGSLSIKRVLGRKVKNHNLAKENI